MHRKFVFRSQIFDLSSKSCIRANRAWRDRQIRLLPQVIEAQAKCVLAAEVVLIGKVVILRTEALIRILTGDELEGIDKRVTQGITECSAARAADRPIEPEVSAGISNGLRSIGVQHPRIDFRSVR